MATPTGGQFVFSAADPVNLVLTADGSVPPATNQFDLEVFTVFGVDQTPATGYEGSGFAPGAALDGDGFLIASSFTANTGDYWITNFGGTSIITAGAGDQTVSGGVKDTIIGGSGNLNVIAGEQNTVFVGSAASATVNALEGDGLVVLGANDATVFAGIGETVDAGAGKGTVIVGTAGTWISLLSGATADSTYTVHATGGAVSGGADSINAIGSKGDTFEFGAVGGATVNALKGDQNIFLGSGNATIYSGDGNEVVAGSGTGSVVFGGDFIVMSGAPTGDGGFTVTDDGGTFTGYAGSVNIVLADGDTVSTGGSEATVNALNPNLQQINLGAGDATVFAGTGDTVAGGSGAGSILFFQDSAGGGQSTNMTIAGAQGGGALFTIANSGGTFTGSADSLNVVGLAGDTIATGGVGDATVNALGGNSLITLGSGDATVYAGTDDTIAAGDGQGVVVFDTGQVATISGASAATSFVVLDDGSEYFGRATSANIIGTHDDTIYIGAGDQTVNAIAGSTVVATAGNDVVFGGDGAEIGIGSQDPILVGGEHLWLNSDLSDGSVGFGTFATLGSTAQVTVGTVVGGAVSEGFDTTDDFLFYQDQDAATTAGIVATQSDVFVEGIASTEFVLPDGTTMTLVGVTDITAGMFK